MSALELLGDAPVFLWKGNLLILDSIFKGYNCVPS
jgi:hypothetical protein